MIVCRLNSLTFSSLNNFRIIIQNKNHQTKLPAARLCCQTIHNNRHKKSAVSELAKSAGNGFFNSHFFLIHHKVGFIIITTNYPYPYINTSFNKISLNIRGVIYIKKQYISNCQHIMGSAFFYPIYR